MSLDRKDKTPSVKGFVTISVDRETYEEMRERADLLHMSMAELIKDAFRAYKSTVGLHGVADTLLVSLKSVHPEWPWEKEFPAKSPLSPYQQILMKPEITEYKSTAWIRSKEYPEKVGWPQFRPLARSFLGELKIEKTLIIPSTIWNSPEVCRWVENWLVLQRVLEETKRLFGKEEPLLRVYVVKEENLRKKGIDEKFYDIGIYGDLVVGFLTISENSDPEGYRWSARSEDIRDAKDAFEKIKTEALKEDEVIKKISEVLHK
jgi:hypothetical protein